MCSFGSLKRDRQGGASVPSGSICCSTSSGRSHNSVRNSSHHFQPIDIRQWHIRHMWLTLVPECDGGNIILQWQIATATAPAESLNSHAQVLLEANRVHD